MIIFEWKSTFWSRMIDYIKMSPARGAVFNVFMCNLKILLFNCQYIMNWTLIVINRKHAIWPCTKILFSTEKNFFYGIKAFLIFCDKTKFLFHKTVFIRLHIFLEWCSESVPFSKNFNNYSENVVVHMQKSLDILSIVSFSISLFATIF